MQNDKSPIYIILSAVYIGTGFLMATERYQSQIGHWSLQYWVPIVHLAPQHLGSPFISIGKMAFLGFARSENTLFQYSLEQKAKFT